MTEEDVLLSRKARAELAWDPRIPVRSIRVGASHGSVEISGHVGDYAAKWRAERALERVRGVRRVVNDIQVVPASSMSDETITRVANGRLAEAGFGNRITAAARAGWLILEGQVRWECERRAAADVVRGIDGLCGLNNAITIDARHRRQTAAGLKRDIEAALRRDAFCPSDVSVCVSHGNVRLAGTVGTIAEAHEAEARAWAARGVRSVVSRLRVEPTLVDGPAADSHRPGDPRNR